MRARWIAVLIAAVVPSACLGQVPVQVSPAPRSAPRPGAAEAVDRVALTARIEVAVPLVVGVPFALRVRVGAGLDDRISLSRPADSARLLVRAPLEPWFNDRESTYGWSAVACAAGDLTIPSIRVEGGVGEDAWSLLAPSRTVRVDGVISSAEPASLRTDIRWLEAEEDLPGSKARRVAIAFWFVVVFGSGLGLLVWRRSRGSRRADASGRADRSAADVATAALRSALASLERGESEAASARDAGAAAARVFVGVRAGLNGLARTSDELRAILRGLSEPDLAAGVVPLIRSSERARYGDLGPNGHATVSADSGDQADDQADVGESLRLALSEIERAAVEPTKTDASETDSWVASEGAGA